CLPWSAVRRSPAPHPPLLRIPPRPVSLHLTGSPLTGLFTPRRVGHRVAVIVIVRSLPPCLDGFLGRLSRDQAIAPRADQVLPPRLDECLPDGEPVLRLEKLHQRPL